MGIYFAVMRERKIEEEQQRMLVEDMTRVRKEREERENREKELAVSLARGRLQEELLYRRYNPDYDQYPHVVLRACIR